MSPVVGFPRCARDVGHGVGAAVGPAVHSCSQRWSTAFHLASTWSNVVGGMVGLSVMMTHCPCLNLTNCGCRWCVGDRVVGVRVGIGVGRSTQMRAMRFMSLSEQTGSRAEWWLLTHAVHFVAKPNRCPHKCLTSPMHENVGADVGAADGRLEGASVGAADGPKVGLADGTTVGR